MKKLLIIGFVIFVVWVLVSMSAAGYTIGRCHTFLGAPIGQEYRVVMIPICKEARAAAQSEAPTSTSATTPVPTPIQEREKREEREQAPYGQTALEQVRRENQETRQEESEGKRLPPSAKCPDGWSMPLMHKAMKSGKREVLARGRRKR
jgi:flagellar biogenesis protein FliO